MRVIELLENKDFSDIDKLADTAGTDQDDGLDFDLVEDLVYFMNNDDDAYRRHVYPHIVKCVSHIKRKVPTKSSIFRLAALECYKDYSKKFPIRGLPESLEEKQIKQVCDKMHEEVCKHASEGKYKD